jgi:hypothetical protein
MTRPDIQYFDSDGTWVKPLGAIRSDIVLQAGGSGGAVGISYETDTGLAGLTYPGGEDGGITAQSIPAADLPDEVSVVVGFGGRPGGRDGYALMVTHLATRKMARTGRSAMTCAA